MKVTPRHLAGHKDERADSGESPAAEADCGTQRPTSREIAELLAAAARPQSATVVVPPALHGLLKEAARRERTALSVIVVRALRAYLSQEYPDLHRRLMPLPADWDPPSAAPRTTDPAHEERPT